ncbi:MAG TPA: hypothetical protein VM913_06995 [Sphingomicrobium sp.]|nr:hypothetical protein [Sphingomicrobium sp.]
MTQSWAIRTAEVKSRRLGFNRGTVMPQYSKRRIIEVVPTRDASGGWKFSMYENCNGSKMELHELIFSKNDDDLYKKGYYIVEFKLDPKGSSLKFHDDEEEVFWIGPPQQGGDPNKVDCCPAAKSKHPPITFERKGDHKLRVKNPDQTAETLAFALGFQEGNDSKAIRYDPVWGNRNGGVRSDATQRIVAAAVALVLLGLAGWVLKQGLESSPTKRKKR